MATVSKSRVNKEFLQAASASVFNSSAWEDHQAEDKTPLADWPAQAKPGVTPTSAEVVGILFDDDLALRIRISDGEGESYDLPLSSRSKLEEGDDVKVDSIYGVLLKKKGAKSIVRFDGEAL